MINTYDKTKTVIVYLAMNTKKDLSYGRDSRSMLEKSLDSLYLNYNNTYKHDIIIFYDNKTPFLKSDQEEVIKGRPEIKFHLLEGNLWSPPDCQELLNNPDLKKWVEPHFSLGYRNMMRWYGILIYKYLSDIGYEWYMRMDDDSLLHSQITYDLFKYMFENNYEYGFRAYCNDHINVSNGLIEYCYDYCRNNKITPTFLNRFTLHNNSLNTNVYNILGYYNNFLISKLSFWMRDDVQKFLKDFDNTGFQYTKRWNDLISQAVTIQIFMDRKKIKHFNDWCYEHTTFSGNYDNKTNIAWGGLYPQINNKHFVPTTYTEEWKNKYGIYYKNTFDTLNIKDCLDKINVDLLYCKLPQNTNFKPLNNNTVYYLGDYDNIEDVYYAIEDYWINCKTQNERAIQFEYPKPIAFTWFNSEKHNYFYKKLYVINDKSIINYNYDTDSTSFNVTNDLLDINTHKYYSNITNNDKFVHYIFGNNKGYYIEAGAVNGITNSNTLFLENALNWNGILVEPSSIYRELCINRPKSKCFNFILGNKDTYTNFIEFSNCYNELSCTQSSFENLYNEDSTGRKDIINFYNEAIKNKNITNIEQKLLDTILDSINAPLIIDYLSLDVEGSEEEIINSINLSKRTFLLISCENLYKSEYLELNGYVKIRNPFDKSDDPLFCKHVEQSKTRPWDFWYASSKLIENNKSLFDNLIYKEYNFITKEYI